MANVVWIGAAQDVAQVDTITFAGTWAASETVSVTCNNKTVTVTGDATMDTPAEYAAALKEALSLANATVPSAAGDFTINAGGRQYGEFYDFNATVEGAVVTLTSRVPGVPFTVTVAETSTSGTATHSASATAATGKNWFNNADNWSGGSNPIAGDLLTFDHGNASVLYGLNNSTLDYDLVVTNDYQGHIGLPRINSGQAGLPYVEYRDRYLSVPVTVSTVATHYLGKPGSLPSFGRRYLDFGTNLATNIDLYILDSGQASNDGAAVQVVGGHKLIVRTYGGDSEIGTAEDENPPNIRYLDNLNGGGSGGKLRIGTNATFENISGTIDHYAGDLTLEAACNGNINSLNLHGGNVKVEQTSQITTMQLFGGKVDWRGTAFDNLTIIGGEFDANRCEDCTATNNINLHKGFTYRDRHGVINKAINFNDCTELDGTLELRANRTSTPTLL